MSNASGLIKFNAQKEGRNVQIANFQNATMEFNKIENSCEKRKSLLKHYLFRAIS